MRAPVWQRLVSALTRLGYSVRSESVNAADFGAAQCRRRSFTIGSRVADVRLRPIRDEFGHRTVRSAWEDLPSRPDGRNWHYAPAPSPLALRRMRLDPTGRRQGRPDGRSPELCPPSWWRSRVELTDVWGRALLGQAE